MLDQALAGDSVAVAGTLDAVVKRDGDEGIYQVARCLADAMAGESPRRTGWSLDFPGIDGAEYDARWVARFVSAYINDDELTEEALFGAAIADGKLPECLLTLAGSTAATLRHREA